MVSNLFTQQWINNYNFSANYPGYNVIQMQFLNADLGFTRIRSGNTIKILKTTNRGTTWNEINSYNVYPYDLSVYSYMYFINELTGFRSHVPQETDKNILDKTTDGGMTWIRKINSTDIFAVQPLIGYTAEQGFYLLLDNKYPDFNLKIYRSTDGFETKEVVYDQYPGLLNDKYRFMNAKSFEDGQIAAVGFVQRGNNTDYFRLITNSQSPYIPYITTNSDFVNNYLKFEYIFKANNNFSYLGTQENVPGGMSGTRLYFDLNQNNSTLINSQYSPNRVGGLSFSSNNKGFALIDDKVYLTLNSGQNWSQDAILTSPITTGQDMLTSFGDACYAISSPGFFHTRKISGSYNTNYDWQAGLNGSITVDGENISTPNTGFFRGGTVSLTANQYIVNNSYDTAARFYYWGGNCNGSMGYNSGSYLTNSGSLITADYKTKMKSSTPDALKNANQVNILKDTNGVINLIYESMEGIFYTRSKNANGDLKREEILSGTVPAGYVTYQNKNPYISEIKWPSLDANMQEKNIVACWERKVGNSIKIYDAFRTQSYPEWPWINNEKYIIENVPEGFEAFPKVFALYPGLIAPTQFLEVITFLKPDGSDKKLMARVYLGENFITEYVLMGPSNIQEYAIASIANVIGEDKYFNLNIAYRKNQIIGYKRVEIGKNISFNSYFCNVIASDPNLSTENSRWRASLDITLKNTSNSTSTFNMQPVITYQGRYDTRIIVENEDGSPSEITGSYYPIYVRERLSDGTWNYFISYNPGVNIIQFTPSVEGSKRKNSFMLSYAQGSNEPYKFIQTIPEWNGVVKTHGFFCSPGHTLSTDAKLIKGGLINDNFYQDLVVLFPDPNRNGVFTLEKRSFTITNGEIGDGNYDEVYGIVEDNDVKYSFNLGNIMVNGSSIGFPGDLDNTLENSNELSNNMVSQNFLLNENDTLVIGRNASYCLEATESEFREIEYWVKLMNKSKNEMHRLLVHDTLHFMDSLQFEFLEGYIIRNISAEGDSFYVQLEIDTVDGNFGIGGGIGGDEGSGDNTTLKRKIFWENDNMVTNNSNNIPTTFNLYQNFPNPFNPSTLIKYDLPKDVNVTIRIYDLLGREVATLVNNEFKNAGRYELAWNALNYATGVYIYRIEAGDFVSTKKMVLIK